MFFGKIKLAFRKVKHDISLLVQNQQRLRERIYLLEKRLEYLEKYIR
ncbi:hypothetical protein KY328_00030 [Candidatus Woesearchaeota archaeon]|nr:hypothetical protein [Candidatus Woesearchaeota archaeon]